MCLLTGFAVGWRLSTGGWGAGVGRFSAGEDSTICRVCTGGGARSGWPGEPHPDQPIKSRWPHNTPQLSTKSFNLMQGS